MPFKKEDFEDWVDSKDGAISFEQGELCQELTEDAVNIMLKNAYEELKDLANISHDFETFIIPIDVPGGYVKVAKDRINDYLRSSGRNARFHKVEIKHRQERDIEGNLFGRVYLFVTMETFVIHQQHQYGNWADVED